MRLKQRASILSGGPSNSMWYSFRGARHSPNGNQDVCYLRLDGAWSFIRNISDDPQNSYHPKILLYANRVLHVLWHDDRTYDVLHRYFR